jgi:hypothetical protein
MTPDLSNPDVLRELRRAHGSLGKAADATGVSRDRLQRAWRKLGLPAIGNDGLTDDERLERAGGKTSFVVDADGTATLSFTAPANAREVDLGDVDAMLRERGLEPADWHVERVKVNEWDALADGGRGEREPRIVKLRQLTAHLVPKTILEALFRPAALPPLDDLAAPKPLALTTGSLGILTGCWQYPYHDETFEGLFEQLLTDVDFDFGIDHGDGMDLASNSRHPDDPATSDPAQASVDAYGLALYRRRKASPSTHWTLLLGNHDVRFITDALARAERIATIRPAVWPGEETQRPLLDVTRALRTAELGVDVCLPPFGSAKYAAAEHVVTDRYIAIHGVETKSVGAAKAEVERVGCSVSMAHTHRQRLFSVRLERGPFAAVDATGVEVGCGMKIGGRGSLYARRPDWANGAFTVTLGTDGEPFFEPIRYRDGVLRWRSCEWRA